MRSKLALVILGALLLGSAGALLGAVSAGRPPTSTASLAASSSTNGSNSTGAAATATSPGSPTSSPGASPTSTQVPSPTATRVPPTPTPTFAPGQTVTIRGDISNIDPTAKTFVLNTRGGSFTCYVNSGGVTTTFTGLATSFGALQPGMHADMVVGVYEGGGSLSPVKSVDTQRDN